MPIRGIGANRNLRTRRLIRRKPLESRVLSLTRDLVTYLPAISVRYKISALRNILPSWDLSP